MSHISINLKFIASVADGEEGFRISLRRCIIKSGFTLLWGIVLQIGLRRCYWKYKTLLDPVR
jgi:hypothetical protein